MGACTSDGEVGEGAIEVSAMSEVRDIEGKKEESLLSFAPAVVGPDCGS